MGGKTTTSGQASAHFNFDFGQNFPIHNAHRAILEGTEGGSPSNRTTAKRHQQYIDSGDIGIDHLCVGDSDDPFSCLFCKGPVTHGFDDIDYYRDPQSCEIDPLDPLEA